MLLFPLDGSQHRLHRIDGEPFLKSAGDWITESSQNVSRFRERENVIPNRVIVGVPFHGKSFFSTFNVSLQRPVGKPTLFDGARFFDEIDDALFQLLVVTSDNAVPAAWPWLRHHRFLAHTSSQ